MNPDHLRAAIEKIGIEKPSDYTLVLEEVGRMEAEEKLVERVAHVIDNVYFHPGVTEYDTAKRTAVKVIEASGLLPLLTASEAFIREAEEMGWGKTSDKAMPGSFDALKLATEKLR